MIRSVNIDGKDYIIRSCESCPFYDWGDEGYDDHCQYPVNPSKLEESSTWGMLNQGGIIAKDCPLGLVKDCCTCRYEEMRGRDMEPCIHCTVTWNSKTHVESPPSKWEVKE